MITLTKKAEPFSADRQVTPDPIETQAAPTVRLIAVDFPGSDKPAPPELSRKAGYDDWMYCARPMRLVLARLLNSATEDRQ